MLRATSFSSMGGLEEGRGAGGGSGSGAAGGGGGSPTHPSQANPAAFQGELTASDSEMSVAGEKRRRRKRRAGAGEWDWCRLQQVCIMVGVFTAIGVVTYFFLTKDEWHLASH